MNSRERNYLDVLIKRRDFLQQRIDGAGKSARYLSFDRSERAALDWAIGCLTNMTPQEQKENSESGHSEAAPATAAETPPTSGQSEQS